MPENQPDIPAGYETAAANSQAGAPSGGRGHEESDFNVRGILYFGIVLTVLGVVALAGTYWPYQYFGQRDRLHKQSDQPLARSERDRLPAPPPLLEGLDPGHQAGRDYGVSQSERAEKYKELNKYGFVNDKRDVVRIPIEEAMAAVVRESANERAPAPPKSEPPPSDSNSGRGQRREAP